MKFFVFAILFAFIFDKADAQYSLFVKDDKFKIEQLPEASIKKQLDKYNFSALFTCTDNSVVYGFIGNNYLRLRIKFISVTKNKFKADTYDIYGKSMVKGIINEFNGTIIIKKISKQKTMSYGLDDEYKNKGFKGEFIISGSYTLSENPKQNHTGVFKGTFRIGFYLDRKYKVHYDDINIYSDGYINNLFTGIWIDYKTQLSKKCNWGDYRIPASGNFDIGAGGFSPGDKYLQYGWQSVRDYSNQTSPNFKNAKQIEEAKWWK